MSGACSSTTPRLRSRSGSATTTAPRSSRSSQWIERGGAPAQGLLAVAHALGLDPRLHFLHRLSEHGRDRNNGRGVAIGPLEYEFAGDVHVELTAALQTPPQALRREFVLHLLAGRVGCPVNGTERPVEIVDVGGAQAAL